MHALNLRRSRDALLYVPHGLPVGRPAPLVVMLHGAGGTAQHGLTPLLDHAERSGLLLLAPTSAGRTWDVILGGFGPDVAFIDAALTEVFARHAVDEKHLVIEGFSDGASYALSIGLTNGDLFTHVVAFSPGFVAPGDPTGMPHLFMTHGTRDSVLPIDRCSRRIVAQLSRAGYDVRYEEFDGPHVVPDAEVQKALAWLDLPPT